MELKELIDFTINLFGSKNKSDLPEKLFEAVRRNDFSIYQKFCNFVENDLSNDYMQMIFQYYYADRKNKMQDYTPKSLADFMGLLLGKSETVVDLCAGSGALTIQKWSRDKQSKFILYELDERVIPFLLFNMAIRNIECIVYHSDVLRQEIFCEYQIKKGEEYGIFKEVSDGNISNI